MIHFTHRLLRMLAGGLLAGTVLTGSGFAQQPGPLAPRDQDEHWISEPPVAQRGVVVGLMTDPQAGRPDLTRLYAYLPGGAQGVLCVTIASRDGRYEAWMEYAPGTASGRVELTRTTARQRELRDYPPEQLALLAHLGDGCRSPVREYLVASWNPRDPGGRVMVMVNSRLRAAIRAVGPSGTEMTECQQLRESRVVAFNRICRLTMHPRQRVRLLLQRADPPNHPPAIPVPVVIP
ncbi:MAG TPA: hypothetical protein VFY65_16795 [Longimicrobium sp.]|nr:hypothetical protein [Longimicrobium sp.]